MVERLAKGNGEAIEKWTNSLEGLRIQNAFQEWTSRHFPGADNPESRPIALDQICERTCRFFMDQYEKLELTSKGRAEVNRIWKAAARYLESSPLRSLLRQSL